MHDASRLADNDDYQWSLSGEMSELKSFVPFLELRWNGLVFFAIVLEWFVFRVRVVFGTSKARESERENRNIEV